ncbi:hypothetical protein LXT13_17955 [Pelomonas sp. P8]|uniref:SlyX family protein n=1 Tax=Pelomonas cellulosilytica TaxID=2906762 RepID=A0ABS8Y069_9BURK|nr:hypothetical protein [Pelomonas sp. P8]MCE4556281.1 hypothetical protein [Pelomonas sp. P8]
MNGLVRELNRVHTDVLSLNTEVADELAYIRDQLQSLLDHYEATLSAHNIEPPYSKS